MAMIKIKRETDIHPHPRPFYSAVEPIDYPRMLPFPSPGTIRANWHTPRFDMFSKPNQFHAQCLFWATYDKEETSWEALIPMSLFWRRRELLHSIQITLGKLRSPPVAGKHMMQLCVLQREWDTLMNDISQFFAKGVPDDSSKRPLWWHGPGFLDQYIGTDAFTHPGLHMAPPIHLAVHHRSGMDPMRPEMVLKKRISEKPESRKHDLGGGRLGPILTNPMDDGEVANYRCGVVGCRGAWWFESALRDHQNEMPHTMIEGELPEYLPPMDVHGASCGSMYP